ncbi:MAG: EamA family transporter [Deltaproteobacteria bacterium]|nr:EamA family transporter [Deltaproteobacteria bacterium]
MLWVILAFTTAFSLATADALSKKAMTKSNEYVIAWVREGYALPFIALAFIFIPIPHLDKQFWISTIVLLPLEIIAIILYVKAVNISPLSLTIPFMALSPAFVIVISYILLGELPDKSGFIGILLIVLGAYLLNANGNSKGKGLLFPLKAIVKEKGSVFMIIVSLIYSITSTIGKIAVQHSSPVFFGFFYPFLLTIILSVILGIRGCFQQIVSRPRMFLIIGFVTSIMIVSHFMAISMADVAYVISIKRTNLIFSIVYGTIIFKEVNIRERMLGSMVMLAGVVSITLF